MLLVDGHVLHVDPAGFFEILVKYLKVGCHGPRMRTECEFNS